MNEASRKIDSYLADLPKWQSEKLAIFRKLITDAEPSVEEDWKWNVPVFLLAGKIVFAMSAFKADTKFNFILNGAQLRDNDHLFNNGFDSKKSRGIDLTESDQVNEPKLPS